MKKETIKKKGFALSLIAFPLMLLIGFVIHPNLLKMEALQTVEQLVVRFQWKENRVFGYGIQTYFKTLNVSKRNHQTF